MLWKEKLNIISHVCPRQAHDLPVENSNDKDVEPGPKQGRRFWFTGWKGTLYLGSATSFVVLMLNLITVSWATFRNSDDRQTVLYRGSCERVKQFSLLFHLLINTLSTLLLASSNFAMQCLSAPSRNDVDSAHARSEWLQIGVSSIHNLLRIPRLRLVLWVCLALSSTPLHLFFNSVVYPTIVANAFDVYVGGSIFTSLTLANVSTDSEDVRRLVQISDQLESLQPSDCIAEFSTNFQSTYSGLVLISDEIKALDKPVALVGHQSVPTSKEKVGGNLWMCGGGSCPDISPSNWEINGYKVSHCLAERAPGYCTIEYSLPLAVVVIGANLVKAIFIYLTTILLRGTPLLTVGDAVASFLRSPDSATSGNCLVTERQIALHRNGKLLGGWCSLFQACADGPQKYTERPRRRMVSVSRTRWCSFYLVYTVLVGVSFVLLRFGLDRPDQGSAWSSGLGDINPATIIEGEHWPTELIPNVLVANAAQLIFSVLYFMLNGILTNMALAVEWSGFSLSWKGLRVSTPPQGHQRATHFLTLPYRYMVPLISISALLHWLISQSIFLIRVFSYSTSGGGDPVPAIIALGYSPLGIVVTLGVSTVLPVGMIWMGCRRLRTGMPVAGSCSVAIAAACHPHLTRDDDELDIGYQLVRWGVQPYQRGEIPHCTFSDQSVREAFDDARYQ